MEAWSIEENSLQPAPNWIHSDNVMIVTGKISEVREEVRKIRASGRAVGFVPTMGALHEGHLSLMRRCREEGCWSAASIYVNPAQFGPKEDLDKYPRPFENDRTLCEREGVDLLFNPADAEMYPEGHSTWVTVEGITERLCGAIRPGHFKGVATVVTKLLAIVSPDAAYFGRKDYQQLKVIERMTADLNLPVRIVGCPTVRDHDGLALSSRNVYLAPQERQRAGVIPRLWGEISSRWAGGARTARELLEGLNEELAKHADAVEYFGAYHPETLRGVKKDEELTWSPVVALAVRIGATRLIDNFQPGVDSL
jgi:pantoate--beta-alanine ligase